MADFRIEIVGDKELNKLLKDMPMLADRQLKAMFAEGAIDTQREALDSIRSHRSNGQTYRRGNIQHTASSPGSPPNTDTGELVGNITIQEEGDAHTVGSRQDAPYGAWLEFGTTKMAARPWLIPAFNKIIKPLIDKYKRIGLK